MHIKKLEISGFKSFLDKTVIHFDHDVIGIVGPNGCGKSNIVDAIRWCMGEQSAKHLRGKSMEDVIFNGSETRPAHGVAEVTITFDNSDPEQAATLPLEYREYAEIAVSRRLFRDGTSEYLVNKAQVRLKDIVDLFLGTGVGTKAYSIVEQGRIGLIVSARAEDRRSLIEEAAGITKYKARKKASERKMELTEQNLLRVGDRVGELERSVASLKRQAAKAERYVAYRNELEELQLHSFSHKLLELVALDKFAVEQREATATEAQAVRSDLEVREVELETARTEALALEQATEKAQNEAFAADNEVRTHEAEIARAKDQLAHVAKRLEAAGSEQIELSERARALDGERGEIARKLSSLEEDQEFASGAALEEHEALESLRESEQAADAALGELRAKASSASSQVAAAGAKLAGYERRLTEMTARREKLSVENASLADERAELEGKREDLEGRVDGLSALKERSREDRARIEQELAELKREVLESERSVETSKRSLDQQRARLRALEELRKRLEGIGDGAKHLLKTQDPTLLGLVAERIEAPAEVTDALAGLLGDGLETIVVSDPERAIVLLAELAENKRGRATVVPRFPKRTGADAERRGPLDGPGVLGSLIDRLSFSADDAELVHALVGDAVLVESAAAALSLASLAGGRALVSLDGTVIYADGRISGGSGDAVAAGLVDQNREMRELGETCATLEAEVTEAVERHTSLRGRVSAIGQALDLARQQAHEAELSLVGAEEQQKRTADRLASVERRLGVVSTELGELERQLAEASHEREQARDSLDEGRALLTDAEGAMETATSVVQAWREKVAGQLAVVTERKVALARVKEQVASAKGAIERLARSITELEQRSARLETEQVDLARKQGETAARLMTSRESLLHAVTVAQTAQAALTDARQAFDAARSALGEREALLKALRATVAEVSERLTSQEMTLQKLDIEREHLLGHVRERFRGLDLRKIVGDHHLKMPPDEAHEARISELGQLIDRMGPVNLDAMREYEEELGRLEFLSSQKADLEKALDDLRKAIAQMNRESKRLFKETFDSINERFQALFPKLFRGGRAHLQLTNPEDMLETGIEIAAQPPGKKVGNIELMSGGEKALTAVSLIFAIFQHKPSPFCVLDEVDAPLDEANVARYNELIRDMTDRSQFIVITHIKKTMQAVDVLYGVTMQEPGVSRLVSVKVNEAAEPRSRSAEAATSAQVA